MEFLMKFFEFFIFHGPEALLTIAVIVAVMTVYGIRVRDTEILMFTPLLWGVIALFALLMLQGILAAIAVACCVLTIYFMRRFHKKTHMTVVR